jgi:general secretion pathway protein D
LRASAKFLIGSLALGMFVSEASATGGPAWVHGSWTSPLALVQTPSGGSFQPVSSTEKAEAEKWLRNAQRAMEEGRFDLADYSIRQAEEHASRMTSTDTPLAYTPQQAREELAKRSRVGGAPAAAPVAGQQMTPKQMATQWLGQAQAALAQGDIQTAMQMTQRAGQLQLPENAYAPGEMTPWAMDLRIRNEMQRRGMVAPANMQAGTQGRATQGLYNPNNDPTQNQPAASQQQVPGTLPAPRPAAGPQALDAQQDLLRQKLTQEVFRERAIAEKMVEQRDPRGGLDHLKQLRDRLDQAQIDPAARRQLLSVVDREINELEQYIQRNMADITNDETNAQRYAEVQQLQQYRIEVEQKIALLVEDFNKMMDENRWAEAEVLARQAHELAPELPVVQNMIWKSKYARNLNQQLAIREAKRDGVVDALTAVEDSSAPFDDRDPFRINVERWEQIAGRAGMSRERQRSSEELRIMSALKSQKVDLRFDNTPLAEALDILGAQSGLNFFLDQQAMIEEAVTSDTPVSINLPQSISLESGLTLLLENLNLTFEVRDDVIRVTTPAKKSQNGYQEVYYVGDLAMPIPNFVPTYNMGLSGALANAYQNLGYGPGSTTPAGMMNPAMGLASNGGGNTSIAGAALAQQLPGSAANGGNGMFGQGPSGMGGGIQADFDPLMELIQRTIEPESWEDLGGTGRMAPFEANLSLVIYQNQEVHEQIQDLLDQLRRLQDLQITIEVRFITLQDDFFERIGVDFDFDVRNTTPPPVANGSFDPNTANSVVGLSGSDTGLLSFPADLDIKFDQNSFGSAIPTFGGFDPNTAMNFGFAILSDIEVFMLLQAAKGDARTNILQAPKVTLFNGQTALVNDTAQRPFVTGIIPVVGDFAAAQMPVVIVLNEGTQLSVNAVASDDRRFVRLTLVPFFSQIGDVEEFTYEGTETTTSGTAVADPTDPDRTIQDGAVTTRTGSTVQLPVFASTSVNTTVSVPDGGTVLLGGIKRLKEGRNERGVPMLSSLPFVNRLFKNVGLGRETQSLMMMVTPRIIIQEEEAQTQVGLP